LAAVGASPATPNIKEFDGVLIAGRRETKKSLQGRDFAISNLFITKV
jgi:hypothetical protein